MVNQSDVVGLLSVGSAAQPKEDVLQMGDAGNKQLVAVKEEGERGLATYFQKDKNAFKGVLAPNGLPPLPTSRHPQKKRYVMLEAEEQAYSPRYVIDTQEAISYRETDYNKNTAILAERLYRHTTAGIHNGVAGVYSQYHGMACIIDQLDSVNLGSASRSHLES